MSESESLNSPDFYRNVVGWVPDPTEEERLIEALATEYNKRCNEFDEKVCSCRTAKGVAMPNNTVEYLLVTRNAASVKEDIKKRAHEVDLRWKDVLAEIQRLREKSRQ